MKRKKIRRVAKMLAVIEKNGPNSYEARIASRAIDRRIEPSSADGRFADSARDGHNPRL